MNMPLIWSLLSIAVHILGMIAIRIRETAQSTERVEPSKGRRRIGSLFESINWKRLVRGQDSIIGESLLWLASLAGILHMIFGVLVLSSLLFVGAVDAIPVLMRYAASAVICHAILSVELASMWLDLAD